MCSFSLWANHSIKVLKYCLENIHYELPNLIAGKWFSKRIVQKPSGGSGAFILRLSGNSYSVRGMSILTAEDGMGKKKRSCFS